MIDFGYNNKKTNIKVNILLAAFLEIELYDNIDCHVMINSLFKKTLAFRVIFIKLMMAVIVLEYMSILIINGFLFCIK